MNHLPPELKRLMRWANQAPASPGELPYGFSQRVVHLWRSERPIDSPWIWQRAIWKSGWAAALVILFGLAVLAFQKSNRPSPYDVSPAFEVVSTELVP